jgi:hypothetical protein
MREQNGCEDGKREQAQHAPCYTAGHATAWNGRQYSGKFFHNLKCFSKVQCQLNSV